VSFDADDRLRDLEERGLLRHPYTVGGSQGPELTIDGRRVLSFSSNNYLGLADDPRLIETARDALIEDGLGAGASRLISGTMRAHREAEQRLADFVCLPAALLFSSGYAANVASLPALLGPEDAVFSDALNHASLIDGCRLAKAATRVYHSCNPAHLDELLRSHRARYRHAVVATDALFSMDGHPAPLAALRELADRYDAALYVDEAHSLGVFGPSGRGLCAELGITPDLLLGTLGKSFGASGAFLAADASVIRLLENRARSFVFSTAMPPTLARVAARAAALVEAADDRRAQLHRHADRLRSGLAAAGYRVPEGRGPIVPVLIGDPDATMRLSRRLLDAGILAHGIRPPTVPEGTSRLRVVPMATHTPEHIEQALDTFRAVAE
jgi:glycine C-acetyltransferase/8-amino-7-oxononanoate synthase